MFEEIINSTPIVIVGAGPVGMTMGLFLAKQHIPFFIIDKEQYLTESQRAVMINQESLNTFGEIGFYDEIIEKCFKYSEVQFFRRNLLFHKLVFNNTLIKSQNLYHIEQNILRQILEEKLQKRGVIVSRGCKLINIEGNQTCKVATINDNGIIKKINTQFILISDTDDNTIRKLIGIDIESLSYEGYFLLIEVSVKDIPFERTQISYYLNKVGYLAIIPIQNNLFCIAISFKTKYEPQEISMSSEYIEALVFERSGINLEISNIHFSTHSAFGHRLCKKIAHDNIILLGESLYKFSSINGININVGIQDAATLGKLIINMIEHPEENGQLKQYETERLNFVRNHSECHRYLIGLLTRNNTMKRFKKPCINLKLKNLLNEETMKNFINF